MDKKLSILIIDDTPENLKVAANILKSDEYTIYISKSGEKGLEIAKLKIPDLILLDIQMPEMDGFEVCRILKNTQEIKHIPIIFMTAHNDDVNITKAFDAGAVDYITKPIRSGEMIARVRTQMNLAKTISKLEEVNAIKDKFFSIISHDLRGPVGAINVMFKIILESFDEIGRDNLLDIIKKSNDSIEKTYDLLENLLGWAKAQSGNINVNKKNIDVLELLNDVVDTINLSVVNKKIAVKNNLIKSIYVQADYRMMETVLRNLLTNSIKFTKENGIIEVGAEETDEIVELYVRDSGVGMSQEIIESLFKIEKMKSREGTSGEKGSGLGLFLCDEFVKLHGGEIKVESNIGIGSKFTFSILK